VAERCFAIGARQTENHVVNFLLTLIEINTIHVGCDTFFFFGWDDMVDANEANMLKM